MIRMSERRYSEDEVVRIFESATEAQKSSLPMSRSDGLTLRELQEVGREVGLPPELIERAARSLGPTGRVQSRKLLGLPIGVGHTIELERSLTEPEWHQLVADLRETFEARGKLSDQGPFKQWTNGNLEVLLEPTPTGQRLRMRTKKGSALAMMTGGLTLLGMAVLFVAMMLIPGGSVDARGLVFLGGAGVGMIGLALAQLPAWARLRRLQMERIASRVGSPADADRAPDPDPAPDDDPPGSSA
jgi:hypothetical protein